MVRLKEMKRMIVTALLGDFNSNMVRLKVSMQKQHAIEKLYFNSNMVRLKEMFLLLIKTQQ